MNILYIRRHFLKFVKQSRLVFCLYEWITSSKDVKKETNSFSSELRKPTKTIKEEIRKHKAYWHCGSFTYKRYGLAYKNLSIEQILDFVPNYYHHKKLEQDHNGIDTIKYSDKLIQCKLFLERNIPSAKTIGYCSSGELKDIGSDKQLDWSVVEDYLSTHPKGKVFIKPTGGQGGAGIFVLKKDNNGFVLNGDSLPSVKSITSRLDSRNTYIVQEGVVQSSQINHIYSGSVNTLRVIVQKEGDRMIMKTCSMRIGQNGADVDNSCQGGICIKIDTDSGEMAPRAKSRFDGIEYEVHPDTNTRFQGVQIDNWIGVKQQIESIATKLIDFKNIALDIAVTDDGAKLLEFNFRYGIEHQQCVLGGVRQLLDIYPN